MEQITAVKKQLAEAFEMKDLGPAKKRMEILRDRTAGNRFLHLSVLRLLYWEGLYKVQRKLRSLSLSPSPSQFIPPCQRRISLAVMLRQSR